VVSGPCSKISWWRNSTILTFLLGKTAYGSVDSRAV
jgi:hypothetical protein